MAEKKEKKEKMNKVDDFYEGDDQWYTIDEYLDEEDEDEDRKDEA